MKTRATLSALAIGMLSGSLAWAEVTLDAPGKILLAGEILIGPDKSDVRPNNGARNQRERASAYKKGTEDALPVTVAEEEDGILAPRGGAPAEERAYDNRVRARTYQPVGDQGALSQGMNGGSGDLPVPATTQDRAKDMRNRARSWAPGEIDLSHVGPDGVPLVPCKDVDNVTGRIGDDVAAGSIFYIMRNGKPVKVRCK